MRQLDSNSSGTVDEAQFLEVLKVVTRADATTSDTAPDADAGEWRALGVRYVVDTGEEGGRAQVDVAIRRIEVSLTPEPLAMILGILQCTRSQRSDAGPKQGEESAIDLIGLVQAFRSQTLARDSQHLRASPVDIAVCAGPLDIAVLPNADAVRGESALVLQVAQVEYHDRLGKLPESRASVDGAFPGASPACSSSS